MAKKDKPNPKEIRKRMQAWFKDEGNNPHRLVSQSKLKELVKHIDPDGRMDKQFHQAVYREVGMMVSKALVRCHGNKRGTLRGMDL